MAPPAAFVVDRLEHLPERIQRVVEGARAGAFVLAVKTSHKPNATVPLIWLVITAEALLLCNTHRTRGLWGRFPRKNLPPLRFGETSASRAYLELHAPAGILTLTLPENLSREAIDRFLTEYKRSRLGG